MWVRDGPRSISRYGHFPCSALKCASYTRRRLLVGYMDCGLIEYAHLEGELRGASLQVSMAS